MISTVLLLAAAGMALTQGSPEGMNGPRVWEFVGEEVCLDIADSSFTVRANYHFHVPPGRTLMAFLYPFPQDSSLGAPQPLEVSVSGPSGWEALTVTDGKDGWRWIAESITGEECAIRVAYRQAMFGERARYVLRSTREWGRPVDRAVLEVRVPMGRQCSITPILSRSGAVAGQDVFRGEFQSFLPAEDLIVDLSPSSHTVIRLK